MDQQKGPTDAQRTSRVAPSKLEARNFGPRRASVPWRGQGTGRAVVVSCPWIFVFLPAGVGGKGCFPQP